MPHATHFLSRLERVSDEHVALAMTLYRDPELVKAVLQRAAAPERAERVALALEDGPGSPHLVLGREGQFITCLGPGMAVSELPIISRARLEAAKGELAVLRERAAAAKKELGPDGEGGKNLFTRLLHAGPRLAREEFQALLTLVPFLWPRLLLLQAKLARRLPEERVRLRRRRGPGEELAARIFAHEVWASSHLASLVLADWPGRDELLGHLQGKEAMLIDSILGLHTNLTSTAGNLRGAHAVGRIGKPFLPALNRLWLEDSRRFMSGGPLVVAAVAHRKLAPEIEKHLARGPAPEVSARFLKAIADGEQHGNLILEWGQALASARLHVGPHLVYGDRRDVPRDVVTAVFAAHRGNINEDAGFEDVFILLPFIARARPEELYLPARLAQNLDHTEAETEGFAWADSAADDAVLPPPARRAAVPGRNDPCSCGSGKKYKKCCAP